MRYLDELYGEYTLEGVIPELIQAELFQRLKSVHQGGGIFLVSPYIDHTRFEHSIGVMLLIKDLGGSIEAQIAGLIHDISHTAFSHLIDYVLELEEEDYHEKRYFELIKDSAISVLLQSHGFDIHTFEKLEAYPLLESPLPNLSADRIDYTLRDLFQINKVSLAEIQWFKNGLEVFEGRIAVKKREYAEWFQAKYEALSSDYFESPENKGVHLILKNLLKEALAKGQIVESDFWEDDYYLMEKLGGEEKLKQLIKEKGIAQHQTIRMKARAVDPEIIFDQQVKRLSDLSTE
ncbi:MAG: HD domain-containing protein [Bacteroidota bacterium]